MSAADRPYYIYCHTAPNGKRYIGQTCLRPEVRWSNGHGYDYCTYMHRAIEKYGWDNFRHDILCVVHSRYIADLFEKYYIEKYDTFNEKHGYNLTKGGAGVVGCTWDEERKRQHSERVSGENNPMYGRHHSAEVRAKMSRNRSGKKLSPAEREFRTSILLEANKRRMIPISQYDLEGNLIASYAGFSEMEETTGFDHSSVVECCKGRKNTAYGFKWEYVDEDMRAEAERVRNDRTTNKMPVIQLDADGNEVARFSSMSDAGKQTGLNRNKIAECCHGGLQEYAGYKWVFGNVKRRGGRKTPVIQYDRSGNEITRYESIEEASSEVGIQRNRIRARCRGDAKSAGGFIWEFADNSASTQKLGAPSEVVQFDLDGNKVAEYKSLSEAMEATGHDRHRIVECCKGERKSYRGFTWRYKKAA